MSIETLDVTDLAAIDTLAAKYQGQPVDVLFNNAGITGGGPNQLFAKKMDWPLYELVLRTNVIGPLKMAEAFLPNILASQQKKISNVSSSQGSIGSMKNGMLYFYRPSKAALNMEMRNLAIQLKSKGVSVALIDPGPVDTDMMSMLPKKMLRPVETAGSDLIRITDQLQPGKHRNLLDLRRQRPALVAAVVGAASAAIFAEKKSRLKPLLQFLHSAGILREAGQ